MCNCFTDVLVQFTSNISVQESQGSVQACVAIEGELGKSITVAVDLLAVVLPANETVVTFSQTEFIFTPGGDRTQCLEIAISDDNVLEDSEELTIFLSSRDEGVLTPEPLIIQIQDDDSKSYNRLTYMYKYPWLLGAGVNNPHNNKPETCA